MKKYTLDEIKNLPFSKKFSYLDFVIIWIASCLFVFVFTLLFTDSIILLLNNSL